jgi:uncharacterized protein (TIGR02118 family)
MLYVLASFNLKLENFESLEAAERHYLEYHVPLARRLPGLRQYLIGCPIDFGAASAERTRAALLSFDDRDALVSAYRTETGKQLLADEKHTVSDAQIVYMDGEEVAPPS